MTWLDNMKSIAAEGRPGRCPKCGSENTDYGCKMVDKNTRNGYMDIWCNDCKKAYHVSRMKITEGLKVLEEIPKGLKY